MIVRTVTLSRAAYRAEDFPRDGRPQFAIVGRSNVGKSSLINTILGKKSVARVSQTPGKTQAIHFYLVNEKIYVVDLPGYGYAKVSRSISATWRQLISSYLESSDALRLIFLLLDVRRLPSEEDLMMAAWMNEAGVEWVPVLTKADKLSKNQRLKQKKAIAKELEADMDAFIEFSKVTKEGTEQIWRAMAV